jgi:hypothetical protein
MTCSKQVLSAVLSLGLLAGGAVQPATATIQDDIVCWYPDVETPVACDDDDD